MKSKLATKAEKKPLVRNASPLGLIKEVYFLVSLQAKKPTTTITAIILTWSLMT
jgi:hypothetical protein